uniref:Uncharacterized protein n=2 Tax=Antheraea pernyi nuclear polyhedrosis virus TaxID=161494 RepID=A0A2Z6C5Z0_NPVAP|nr:hypothetical protein [Antheraea proylei nucleopolyhedrovirus]BBD51050.1 hypothetical protein [Antheraea pernyi nucleopolyhedrovirus]
MDRVASQVYSGMLPYITTRDIEDCLRNRITANAGLQFFRECFEAVIADKSGLFVLNGGAAAACHLKNERDTLKCLDFDYYNSTREWLQLANMQRRLQACVHATFDKLSQLAESVRMQSYLTILKCFKNGAFCFTGAARVRLLPHVEVVRTAFNDEFDLVRFALRAELWSPDGDVHEYINQKMIMIEPAVAFNVFFVNLRVMKRPMFEERCVKGFTMFGTDYHVAVVPLQRVLTEQIMCLLKDIFTDRPDFKVERRRALIRALFTQLPKDTCVSSHIDVMTSKRRDESIVAFCKKTLDLHGPALGCRKLVHAFLTTDAFVDQVPQYVADHVNYPRSRSGCELRWKEFMGVIFSL